MLRSFIGCILAPTLFAAMPLSAQSLPRTPLGRVVPFSDIRADWLNEGQESPNGRFYLTASYAANDSGFLRYDRLKKSWALLGPGNVGANPRWSPDGRFVAFVRRGPDSRDFFVWLLPMDTMTGLAAGAPRRVSTRPGAGPVTWSPDGRRIAFITRDSGQASIVAVPFNGGDEQILFQTTGNVATPVWSRDGRSIFANHLEPHRNWRVIRLSLADKSVTDLGPGGPPIIDQSPDGKWLAQYHFSQPVLHLTSTVGKSPRRVDLQKDFTRFTPTGWSHTNPGEMVALDHITPEAIQRVDVASGRIRTIVPFDSSGLGAQALSPDERQLAYIRIRGNVRQLVVTDTGGKNVRVLANGATGGTRWSPDGRRIAYSVNGAWRVVEVASKQDHELVPAAIDQCPPAGLNCDGRLPVVMWRTDSRALRYFERRADKDGHALVLHEADIDGRHRVMATTTLSGSPSYIARTDTLFIVRQAEAVSVINVRTGNARTIYKGSSRTPNVIDVNGSWILIVGDSVGADNVAVEQPMLVSLTTGGSKKYPYSLGGEVSEGVFLPDGRNFLLIACVSCRNPGYREKWDIILTPMNGDPPRILTASEASFRDFWPIAATKDGRTVFFQAESSYNTRLVNTAMPKF